MTQPVKPWPNKISSIKNPIVGNTTIVVINRGAFCPRVKAMKAIFHSNGTLNNDFCLWYFRELTWLCHSVAQRKVIILYFGFCERPAFDAVHALDHFRCLKIFWCC